jgi:serine/threonine protein kinase/tetratricopeptide (TPR) repeat protein
MLNSLREALARRYRVEHELGRGGMATVYLAQDIKHGRPVAIKVLDRAVATGAVPERFLREIRIAAKLTHPQIVPLHDSGESNGSLYYVMPYLGCESLRDRLQREGRLPVAEALRIARAVGAALDYAHRQGVVHRDIKPENILLHEGEAMVSDFGVARAVSGVAREGVSEPGIAIGTPAYMSPEQASADHELDGRSDIYSLGCVLYEMLAGQPPFAGTSARATMARHVVEPPPALRALRTDAPVAVEQALIRALAKDPADRFATAAEFCRALDTSPGGAGSATGEIESVRDHRAIAVLPFVNASSDPDTEYFSDGMTDELIDALTEVAGLHVASRTSVFAYKGKQTDIRTIGALLNSTVVLEGTVRKSGRRLRISARLTDVAHGRHLWSQRYDRDVEDVFAVQDEIAQTIVNTLRATLLGELGDPTPRRYTSNLTAYNLYLKGRYCWNKRTQEGIAEGIRYFESAIAADQSFALAYTGLADCFALQLDYRGVPVADGMRRAKEFAMQALALDDSLAEAHTSLAWVRFIYEWDWEGAEKSYHRAIELNPRYATAHQWYAWLLVALGRVEEALAEGRMAVDLDGASVSIRRGLGWLYYYARRYEEAADQLKRALAMNPTAEESHRVLGLVYTQQGDYAAAETELREAIEISAESTYAAAGLGYLSAVRGQSAEARTILTRFYTESRERYVSPVAFATVHAGLGEADLALDWIERAHQERRGWLVYLKVEPLLDPLRSHPRFARLLEALRLVT